MVSSLQSIQQVLDLIGTIDKSVLEAYAEKLFSNGFDTPKLMIGLKSQFDFVFTHMGFRYGHAIKLLNVIDNMVDDIDG